MEHAAGELCRIRDAYGPESIGCLTSARCTNEENYLFQKFVRTAIGTNNVDHRARLRHGPAVAGLALAFGSGATTNSFEELEEADCIFAIGSNTTAAHPIASTRLMRCKANGGKLIVVDPRKTHISRIADIHVQHRLGRDVALLNGMMHVILKNGWHNQAFLDERTENVEAFLKRIEEYPPERVSDITGVDVSTIVEVAGLYARSKAGAVVYCLGITQHWTAVDNVKGLANLAMLCGQIGRPSTGVNPFRGQNNVQGACDMGGLPNVFPGYQPVTVPDNRKKFEAAWHAKLPSQVGLTILEVIQGCVDGTIQAMVILGENPVVSDPDSHGSPQRRVPFLDDHGDGIFPLSHGDHDPETCAPGKGNARVDHGPSSRGRQGVGHRNRGLCAGDQSPRFSLVQGSHHRTGPGKHGVHAPPLRGSCRQPAHQPGHGPHQQDPRVQGLRHPVGKGRSGELRGFLPPSLTGRPARPRGAYAHCPSPFPGSSPKGSSSHEEDSFEPAAVIGVLPFPWEGHPFT